MTERARRSMSRKKDTESPERDFLFPFRWRKKCPRNKFTIADEETLNKILSTTNARPQPEFQGKEYINGIKNEDKLLFKCSEPNCTGIFTTETALNTHKLKHLNRKLKCEFCNMLFKIEEDRTKHINEFHPDLEKAPGANPLQCKKCGRIPRDKTALWRHVRESHRGPPKPCPHCGVLFNRPDNMKEHIKYKHPPEGAPLKVFSCEICGQQFKYRTAMRCHIRKVHREKMTLRCVLCDTTYSCKDSYRNHMRRHIRPTFQPCTICNKKFSDFSKLNRHLRTNVHKIREKQQQQIKMEPLSEDEEPQEVDATEMKFETGETDLTKEELIESCRRKSIKIILHRVDEKKVRYNFSGNPTPKRTVDGKHLSCVYCSKNLPNLEAVTAHEAICFMKIRSTKLHICPHCSKEFAKSSKLKLHMSKHSDERPFPCSYCDSKFKLRNLKIQHEKAVHFGIRRVVEPRTYTCNYEGCERKYNSGKSLQTHVAVQHLGVRHPCDTCGKIFKRKDHLRKHTKECHSESTTLLMCYPCKRTYNSRQSMLLHFTTRRHQRKAKELCHKFGNKEEMTEVLAGKHHPSSSTDKND